MRVKLQILLRKDRRTAEGLATVTRIAESLGIKPTTSGAASLSGEIDPQAFESLFGQKAGEVGPRRPGRRDFGTPGGAVSGVLAVPEPLREYVESITVAPPHIRMAGRREEPPQ